MYTISFSHRINNHVLKLKDRESPSELDAAKSEILSWWFGAPFATAPIC